MSYTNKRRKTILSFGKDYTKTPYGLEWRSNTLFIIATVGIGLFTDLFLYGLVVPILPSILRDKAGVPDETIQSDVSGLLAAYAAASVVTSPFAGILADRLSSRQLPFLVGLFALLMATVLLFVGTTLPVLTIARILQGVSGAFVWTVGLALCLETVGPKNLGKTIGSIFSFVSVGSLCAPLVGGILYEKTGYPGVFGVASALLAVDFIMRALVIEKKVAKRYGEETGLDTDDSPEPSIEQNDHHVDEEQPMNEEQPLLGDRIKDDTNAFRLSPNQPKIARMVPILPCLANPSLLTALLVALVQAILLGSFDATLPLVAREYFGFDTLKAGVLFLPLGAFDLLLGPVFGWAVDRYGTKFVAVGAYTYLIPAFILLRLPHAGDVHQVILYGGCLALCGVGLAGIGAPSLVEAGAVVERYYEANPDFFGEAGPYAQLYGLQSMVFSAGLALGPEIAGQLRLAINYGNMNAVLAGICTITAVLCFLHLGGRPRLLSGTKV